MPIFFHVNVLPGQGELKHILSHSFKLRIVAAKRDKDRQDSNLDHGIPLALGQLHECVNRPL